MLTMRRGAADDVKEGTEMENDAYVCGIPKEKLQEKLEEWLENPAWQEYYEKAPSEQCREFIALEFLYSDEESDEIAAAMDEKEKMLTIRDWQHLYKYCGNNPRKTFIRKKIRELKKNPPYLCHLYRIRDAKEAFKAIETTCVKEYGRNVCLEDGTVLHDNCPECHDEGGRYLLRCNVCGALTLARWSMYECPYWDEPDEYYQERIPVASMEEADLLNILWDEEELKRYPFRYLRRDDLRKLWTNGKEPVQYDPEELRAKIREKYAGLKPKQKEMLEKLISEAGKSE